MKGETMTETTLVLTCPKCAGQMRAYERNGITIDQCTECRGIYLDRGELERLIDTETSYDQTSTPAPGYPPRQPPSANQRGGDGHDRGHGTRRRRGGFLSELFD
jgi:uncharacterized protein